VCFCLAQHSREQLATLLYEQVNDLETRRRLRASWGLCNWHTWMLLELPGSRASTAILSEDLLRLLIERVGRAAATTLVGRLATRLTHARARTAQRLAALYRRRPPCPVCERAGEAEQRYIEALLDHLDDPEFRLAYARSGGLCAPHAMRAVEVIGGHREIKPLLDLTLVRWSRMRQDVAGFIAKHDHRNTHPFTEAETESCRRALELLSGAPGLFGTDLPHRGR
jgi:Family of unknown function (DUF6062)